MPEFSSKSLMATLGDTGLRAYGGFITEEYLAELTGSKGLKTFRRMATNDPTAAAMVGACKQMVQGVEWTVTAAKDSGEEGEQAKLFVEELLEDMDTPLSDVVSEAVTMFEYGFAPCEVTHKQRNGKGSKFSDGRFGIKEISLRAQTSLIRWEMDRETGAVLGMHQQTTWKGQQFIPREKLALFRTSSEKGNPEGKALDPETPIPTPDGWRRMDDLQPGDKVFDEKGRVRYVLARADWYDRPCYKISFDDGFEIVADENHEWVVQSFSDRHTMHRFSKRTTKELARKVKTKGGHTNYSIPWAGALDYPRQELLIDPYVLGYWLGDGNTSGGVITTHMDDVPELVASLEAAGYTARVTKNGDTKGRSIRVYGEEAYDAKCLSKQLRVLGLIGNKHVPVAYMRSSIAQRRDLLAGLMDSDGHVDRYGRCEFSNTNFQLASAVAELVRSLGVGAYLTSKTSSSGNTAWLVKFTPPFAPFRHARKSMRCQASRARTNHYIERIEPIEPRRTVCIQVDSPSHLFLAGEGMVPTHNSILRAAYRPWYFKTKIEEIEAVGIERNNAGLPLIKIPGRYLDPSADPQEKAFAQAMAALGSRIRKDQQDAIVVASDRDANNVPLLEVSLLTTGGKTFSATEVIQRYDRAMARSILADFIFLGEGAAGSFALSSDKTALFAQVVGHYLKRIADTLNRDVLDVLWKFNGLDPKLRPSLSPGDLENRNITEIVGSLVQMGAAGATVFPDRELENHLRKMLGVPLAPEEGLGDQGAPGMGEEDWQLPPGRG